MLVTLREVLAEAEKGGYAVGMFNTINLEMAKGVLAAAETLRSPVIIGTAEVLLPAASLWELANILVPMAKRAAVPVVVHYDHGLTEPKIYEALKLGFTSVMYDCSTDSFESNLEKVARLTSAAHAFGASVEGELGHVGANEGAAEGGQGDHSVYTDPKQARLYAERTGVDALAVAIGNAHGAYVTRPKLDLDILKEIAAAVSCPLVLHGGSGLSDDDFRNCIAHGIRKVNIFTDINLRAARAAKALCGEGGLSDALPGIVEAVKEEAMQKMRLFGSDGRA